MFCRLPIISYDHGGQRDFLEDGKTGFVIPLNHQERFKERLESLTQNAKLREEMGEYNLKLSKRFTIQQCASRYEELFEDVISGKPDAKVFAMWIYARARDRSTVYVQRILHPLYRRDDNDLPRV